MAMQRVTVPFTRFNVSGDDSEEAVLLRTRTNLYQARCWVLGKPPTPGRFKVWTGPKQLLESKLFQAAFRHALEDHRGVRDKLVIECDEVIGWDASGAPTRFIELLFDCVYDHPEHYLLPRREWTCKLTNVKPVSAPERLPRPVQPAPSWLKHPQVARSPDPVQMLWQGFDPTEH